MAAEVRSVAALREYLAGMITHRDELQNVLASIQLELRKALDWVAEQGSSWAREVRRAEEAVVQAKAELAARQFPDWSGRMPDTTVQEKNLRRAEARLSHAQDQVLRCKQWLGRLPKLIEETYAAKGHRLGIFLEGELARALGQLDQRLESLERYAELRTDYQSAPRESAGGPAPPAGPSQAGSSGIRESAE